MTGPYRTPNRARCRRRPAWASWLAASWLVLVAIATLLWLVARAGWMPIAWFAGATLVIAATLASISHFAPEEERSRDRRSGHRGWWKDERVPDEVDFTSASRPRPWKPPPVPPGTPRTRGDR